MQVLSVRLAPPGMLIQDFAEHLAVGHPSVTYVVAKVPNPEQKLRANYCKRLT